MVAKTTPVCDFNQPIIDFSLPDCYGNMHSLEDCKGDKGTLIMFICNHCPYVKAIIDPLVHQLLELSTQGVKAVAIMSNDTLAYPDDSVDNMQYFAQQHRFHFPYLFDEDQQVAKTYGAVCTPDFFGYNAAGLLQYRGRFNEAGMNPSTENMRNELFDAMNLIAQTGKGPEQQTASIGCSIKWKDE